MTIRITDATPKDDENLTRLYIETFPNPDWSTAWFRQLITERHIRVRIAIDITTTTMIGFAVLAFTGDDAEIYTLGVSPKYQRSGTGKRLLQDLLKIAETEAVTHIFLEVGADNLPAQGLYQGYGFEQVGHRRKYYKSGEDALVLSLNLLQKPQALPPNS